jgi:predicted DNA-binding protein (MmcQ/YjbR family)
VTFEDFEAFCLALPAATLSVQWGGTHVFKVGDKVFAMAGAGSDELDGSYVFKTSELSFEILTEAGLAVRAPYLPRGGWLALTARDALPDAELEAYLTKSHRLVVAGLPKAVRQRLGLLGL